jgi:hypothetical protein
VWYDDASEEDVPVVVEFSFRYELDKGKYDGEAAQIAYDIFRRLRYELPEWVDAEGPTKTAYVYSRA